MPILGVVTRSLRLRSTSVLATTAIAMASKLQGIDDFICLWCGVGTHMDGFGHIAIDGKHLHGVPTKKVIHSRGGSDTALKLFHYRNSRHLLDICG